MQRGPGCWDLRAGCFFLPELSKVEEWPRWRRGDECGWPWNALSGAGVRSPARVRNRLPPSPGKVGSSFGAVLTQAQPSPGTGKFMLLLTSTFWALATAPSEDSASYQAKILAIALWVLPWSTFWGVSGSLFRTQEGLASGGSSL